MISSKDTITIEAHQDYHYYLTTVRKFLSKRSKKSKIKAGELKEALRHLLIDMRESMYVVGSDVGMSLADPIINIIRFLVIKTTQAITLCPNYKEFNDEEMCLAIQTVRLMLLEIYNNLINNKPIEDNVFRQKWISDIIHARDLTEFVIYNSVNHDKYDIEMEIMEKVILV